MKLVLNEMGTKTVASATCQPRDVTRGCTDTVRSDDTGLDGAVAEVLVDIVQELLEQVRLFETSKAISIHQI